MAWLELLVRHLQAAKYDLAFALRGLARSPGLTLTIIVSLSLGVGAIVAVFTAIDRVSSRRLQA
jgi:predicted lysophospholipase L1 biosynthesis ABC-type transport system permease subunit